MTMSEERKLKLGFLGVGAIAQLAHLPAAVKAENVDLVAVCDASEEMAREIAHIYGAREWFTDHERFLAEADIEAALIPVPDPFHAPLTIAALEAGKHVLVEKPLALDVPEAEAMCEAAEHAGRQLQIATMKRWDPGLQYAQTFTAHEMGQRLTVSGWYCDTRYHGAYVSTHWPIRRFAEGRKRPEPGPPAHPLRWIILGHGVHLIDTLCFFGGRIAAVTAAVSSKYGSHGICGTLEYEDGATGTFQLTCTVTMDWCEGLLVHGERGSIEAKIGFPYWKAGSEVRVFDAAHEEYRTPVTPDSDPYERQLEGFAAAILGGYDVSPSGQDGLHDQRVLEAIETAVRGGGRVDVA
ncbi:MAG: Gfo/Idh/MocA family oxidoreductase [Armatimonadetes bacterium]|nr:Gfo/Idh/MocA family oxidoreductase [Armatimonadota bacterium]